MHAQQTPRTARSDEVDPAQLSISCNSSPGWIYSKPRQIRQDWQLSKGVYMYNKLLKGCVLRCSRSCTTSDFLDVKSRPQSSEPCQIEWAQWKMRDKYIPSQPPKLRESWHRVTQAIDNFWEWDLKASILRMLSIWTTLAIFERQISS